VNGGAAPAEVKLDFAGAKSSASKAAVITLTGGLKDENSFAEPEKISPVESKIKINSPQFNYTFPANSLTVLRIKTSN
jgi:alpha-N-arabinofuranosidase